MQPALMLGRYFLITPKLLPDLTYTEHMKVLIVINGDWVPQPAEWERGMKNLRRRCVDAVMPGREVEEDGVTGVC